MPIYDYQCVDCGAREPRIAGLDDHTALCVKCGGLMLRLDADVFGPYFKMDDGLSFVNADGETIFAPSGCDGLCRIGCKAHDSKDAYCQAQECEEQP